MELEIPVILVIKDGIFCPGLTKVENVFLGSPPLNRIAATSIILSWFGSRPVVSKSIATYDERFNSFRRGFFFNFS